MQVSELDKEQVKSIQSALTLRPIIYEINTWVWVSELGDKYKKPITLANIPSGELDTIAKNRSGCGLADGSLGTQPGRDSYSQPE
jgi:hypothetical protein